MRLHASVMAAAMSLGVTACAHLPLTAAQPIRVLVLNTHAGKDPAGTSNLDAIASLVRTTGADLVLLHGVDRGTARSGKVEQVNALGGSLHFATAFGASLLNYDGGQYGIAVLARGYIGYTLTVPLPVPGAGQQGDGLAIPGVALLALASLRTGQFAVINTQLNPAEGASRVQEITHLMNAIADERVAGTPLLVGGDFDTTPDNPALAPLKSAGLRDAWTECGSGDGFTFPSEKPAKRIGYLFLTGELHCSAAKVIDTQISDHRPLVVTLK